MDVKIHTSCAKSQNFVDISEAQKPTWVEFLKFGNVYLKSQGLYRYNQNENHLWSHISFVHKCYNEIVDKIVFISPKKKKGQNEILLLFGKHYFIFASDSLSY